MSTAEGSSRARGILMHAGHAQTLAPGSKRERGRVHCKHVQLVFTMFSQPPPRQYNPPLEARTVCQENKKSQQEGGRKERRGGLQKVAAQAAGRWKFGTRGEGRRRRHHQWGLLDEEMAFGGQWQQTWLGEHREHGGTVPTSTLHPLQQTHLGRGQRDRKPGQTLSTAWFSCLP